MHHSKSKNVLQYIISRDVGIPDDLIREEEIMFLTLVKTVREKQNFQK
jgi:hypothetical protein